MGRVNKGKQPEGEVALRLVGVGRRYGQPPNEQWSVVDVNLDIHHGELTTLVGPSGSGKTTLLTILGGLDEPTTGEVWLAGQELTAVSTEQRILIRRRAAGYLFQEYNLIRTLTVLENVTLPLELDGMGWRRARPRAEKALERFGVGSLANRFPEVLSGGEQQRVALARATVGDQYVLLADEPTGALDSHNGQIVLDYLRSLAETGRACVVATHNPEIARAADRVVTLHDGRVEHDTRRTA